MAKQIQMQVMLDETKTLKDGGCRLKLDTQELPENELATLFSLRGGQFWCCLSEVVVKQEDLKIPEYITEKDEKSPSKKLKDRMFVYFKEEYKGTKNFNQWYDNALDEIGLTYLSRIKK